MSRNVAVLKFGGTSVATRAKWDRIGEILQTRLDEGEHPFVVCSAVAGVSDALESALDATLSGEWRRHFDAIEERNRRLADDLEVDFDTQIDDWLDDLEQWLHGAALVGEVTPSLRAKVMATGELLSTQIGTAYLRHHGFDVTWLDARDWLTTVDEPAAGRERRYLNARANFESDQDLQAHLQDGARIHLTQGFIARGPSRDGADTAVLGRGGSDTSAAYFSAKLQAERLEIWTDVPGLFTANPAEVPQARLIKELGYEEAQELATMGAEVLHPGCIDPVEAHSIPLEVRSIEHPAVEGTRIAADASASGPQVKAISSKGGTTLVSMETLGMWQEVGFLADAFQCFKTHDLSIDMVATSETNVTASLDGTAQTLDQERLDALVEDLGDVCQARTIDGCAVVSLVGRQIRSILHELGPALEVFEEQYVHLVSQASSDLNFSFVVDEGQAGRLVTRLHSLLFENRTKDPTLGPTWNALMGKDEETAALGDAVETTWWADRRDELLEVADEESPVYVYDAERIDQSVATLKGLEHADRIFYAMKANPNPDVLRQLYRAGMGFECVSPGEVERVFDLFPDIAPSRILFTPNFCPRAEYLHAFDRGIHVTVDNLHPLRQWPEVFAGQEVLVRVDPGRGRGHHDFVKTAGPRSKFGIAPSQLEECHALCVDHDITVRGLHAHLGSGITEPKTWAETAVTLAGEAERFGDVDVLNLGGGLGVASKPGQSALDTEEVDAALAEVRDAHPDFQIWMEPGRFVVAEAGVLLAKVTQRKSKGDITYVGLETGMNSLIRPALYGAYHPIVNLTRLEEPTTEEVEVVGPICESGDVLGHARRLPETREGDVLLLDRVGAYGRAMSSTYNLREPATEHLLKPRQ
jgi:diaminopimelate decarboxylase/aspartate kinase